MGIRELFRKPLFWLAVCLMVCSGASELAMAQWASAYAEAALGLSKTAGDLAGPCMFAVTMGISRMIFGKYGDRMDLMKFMTGSGVLCVVCYLLTSLSANPLAGLVGCIMCGFSVGIMWPGTISISSERFPAGLPCLRFWPWQGIWAAASGRALWAASHNTQGIISAQVWEWGLYFRLFCW